MKNVKRLNCSPFEEIPTSNIWDIFSRLPTKTCLNCKRVCKDWNSIIIDPEFAAFRSSCGLYRNLLLYVKFVNGRYGFVLFDLDKSSKVDENGSLELGVDATIKSIPKMGIPQHKLFLVNICNDQICLKSEDKWGPYIIVNLLTSQQVMVEHTYDSSVRRFKSFGLGYCHISRQYKLLSMYTTKLGKIVAKIHTVGINEWRVVDDDPAIDQIYWTENYAVFLHGVIHWYSRRENRIWSFCFENEQFLEVPTPPDDMKTKFNHRIFVFDSCLCFSSKSRSNNKVVGEIWLMREYGVRNSWVKQYVFNNPVSDYCMPLLRMGNGEWLVCDYLHYNLIACDAEFGRYNKVTVNGVMETLTAMVCDAKFSKFN